MTSFLTLEDCLAPLPLPAIMAVLMVLGCLYLGRLLSRALLPESPQPLHSAAGFILAASLVAAAVHFLALAGLAYSWLLKTMAWGLVACGLLELARLNPQRLFQSACRIQEIFREQSFWGRTALVLLGITLVGLGLAALGPPTDADSLDYHLGVPLDILRHHGAYPRLDWLHARLTGLGESLNMLGLAGGTDILGAALQFAGMLAALVAVISLARTDLDRILVAMGLLGCPVMIFLVPNQKPQMLPTAATTIALILIVQRFRAIDPATLLMAFWCAFFAMACKYPFLLSGGIVVGVGLLAASRARLLGLALGAALAAYLVLVFPVHLQNFLFYGDPVSPFLERWRPQADAAVIGFAAFLRTVSDSQRNSLPFPVNLILPSSMGTIPTVLGLGTLLVLVGLRELKEPGAPRILFLSAILATAGNLALGQIGARFLLEPYLWIMAAAAVAAWRPAKTFFFKLMVGQMLLMALVASFGAATLFPGALITSLRHHIMTRSAYHYAATRWLDEVLPQDVVVLTGIRAGALMPRPFVSSEYINWANLDNSLERQRISSMLASPQVNTVAASVPMSEVMKHLLNSCPTQRLAGPKEFPFAFRNPWNVGPVNQLTVFRLTADPQKCLEK